MFLDLASEEELRDCFRRFRAATSNESLRKCICVVCARQMALEKGERSSLLHESRMRALLGPRHVHSAQVLWHGALVMQTGNVPMEDASTMWICFECSSVLQKGKIPRYSLANDLWIGEVPHELTVLTIPEQLLIILNVTS